MRCYWCLPLRIGIGWDMYKEAEITTLHGLLGFYILITQNPRMGALKPGFANGFIHAHARVFLRLLQHTGSLTKSVVTASLYIRLSTNNDGLSLPLDRPF